MDHAERIERYFAACSTGSAEDIAANFTRDAVIYDTNHEPVRSADEIGAFWVKIRRRWDGAEWTVDRLVSDGSADAAIEWSMTGRSRDRDVLFRGSEHYRFADDLIDEIRQYWTFDPSDLDAGLGLIGYPYET